MGFTMHKKKTHLPANTGSEIQSCVWGVELYQLRSKLT